MSSVSHEIYSSLKGSEEEGKGVNEQKDKVMVDDDRQEVDINAFFEKSVIDEKMECQQSMDKYSEDNEANRKQRHRILKKIRITRGLSLILISLILLFFIGMIAAMIAAVYLNKEETEQNRMRNHHSIVEPLVDPIQPFIEPNGSVDGQMDLRLDSNDVFVDSNQLISLQPTVPTSLPKTDGTTIQSSDYIPFEATVDDLAPDSSLQSFLERLRNNRNDFKLQDIPPAIDDFMKNIRKMFRLPNIRLEFD